MPKGSSFPLQGSELTLYKAKGICRQIFILCVVESTRILLSDILLVS